MRQVLRSIGRFVHSRTGLLALAVSVAVAAPAQADPRAVAFGDVAKVAPAWPIFIADQAGLFAAEGLKPEATYVGTDSGVIQQVIGGSLEIGNATFESTLRAIDAGAPIRIIGSVSLKLPYSVLASPAIKSAADLKGKTVIFNFPDSTLVYAWTNWLTQNGLKKGDVDQIYDGSSVNRFAALSGGAAVAALLTQPFDMVAISKGNHRLLDYGEYAKGMGFQPLIASTAWLAKNPDTARAFLRAVSRAVQFLYDPANREKSIEILVQTTKIETAIAAQVYDYYTKELKPYSPILAVPDEVVAATIAGIRLSKPGAIADTTVSRFVDRSFLPK